MEPISTLRKIAEEILKKENRPMTVEEIVIMAKTLGLLGFISGDVLSQMRKSLDEIYIKGTNDHSNLVRLNPDQWGIKTMDESKMFQIGAIYSRKDIKKLYSTNDFSVNNGVFRPNYGKDILLFVTAKKTRDRTQYKDQIYGEILEWDGQKSGRTDNLIVNHVELGLNLLVFFREKRNEFQDYGFMFLGNAYYYSRTTERKPSHFILKLGSLQSTYEEDISETYSEGDITHKLSYSYERNPIARAEAIRVHGLTCQVCGFNFKEFYGIRGTGYIEVRHLIPLSMTREERQTDPRKDLVVLCSNCHRMIHRIRNNPIMPEDLIRMIKS